MPPATDSKSLASSGGRGAAPDAHTLRDEISKSFNSDGIRDHLIYWKKEKGTFTAKLRKRLKSLIDLKESPQTIIADLGEILDLDLFKEKIDDTLTSSGILINILIDKIDEGYSPDRLGIALVDGFVQTVIDTNNFFPNSIRAYIFVRDNIYRSIAKSDPDFTRNIESHILRLHWSEYNLFNLVCNRLRIAKNVSTENNRKLWNRYTTSELQNREGFRECLRLTLYRPRDILVLLNNAFQISNGDGSDRIIPEHIKHSSKSISRNRLNDLHKEYESTFPSIDIFTSALAGGNANINYQQLSIAIEKILQKDNYQIEKKKT